MVLSLTSPRWQSLSHAYGDGTDVPDMLRTLQDPSADVREAAWHKVWSALCHQDTVYTATYAAIPYLVEQAARIGASDSKRAHYLIFVGVVAMSTDAAPIPDDLRLDYVAALSRAVPLVLGAIEAKTTPIGTFVYLLQSLAALHGCMKMAELMNGFIDGEFTPRCPAPRCGVELYVTIENATMFATLEDPATSVVGTRTEISPLPTAVASVAATWTDAAVLPLLVELARHAGHHELATKLALLDGRITCPKCLEQFVLRTALLSAKLR